MAKYVTFKNPIDGRWKVVEKGNEYGTAFADCSSELDAVLSAIEFLDCSILDIDYNI